MKMFGFSFKRKGRKQRSWIIDFIVGDTTQIKGQIVKVCRHVSGPDLNGNVTKHVSDTSVFITAVFTTEAIDNYNSEFDEDSPPEWEHAILIIKDYSLSFIPAPSLDDCYFNLVIKKFSLLDLNTGLDSKNKIYDCMEDPVVQRAAKERWMQYMSQGTTYTEDSELGEGQLSLLLDKVMSSPEGREEEEPQASTSKTMAPGEKQSHEGMRENWARMKQTSVVEDWIISTYQMEILNGIEEWKEDYIPPPSLSSGQSLSESGDVRIDPPGDSRGKGSAEKSSIVEKSQDEVSHTRDKESRKDYASTSSPKNSGDAVISSKGQRVKITTERIRCDGDSGDNRSQDAHDNESIMVDANSLLKRSESTENKSLCPTGKTDMSDVREKGKSPPGKPPTGSGSPVQEYTEEYLSFLKISEKPAEKGIEIFEVVTLETLPTTWHSSSPDSIQFSGSSPSVSQDALVCSESCDSSQKMTLPQNNSTTDPNSSNKNGLNPSVSSTTGNVLPMDTSKQCNHHQVDSSITDTNQSTDTNTQHEPETSCISALNSSLPEQKYSTPILTQRKRVDSLFDKTIDASHIARISTSSDHVSKNVTKDKCESLLLEGVANQGRVDSEKKITQVEHPQKRVSFAPSMHYTSPDKQGGTRAADFTDSISSIYVDAKSHLSSPGDASLRPGLPDYPQSQPFTPSDQDFIAEDSGTVETRVSSHHLCTNSYVHASDSLVTPNKSTETNSVAMDEFSFHHSTQSSSVAAAPKPNLFVSPIKDASQKLQDLHGDTDSLNNLGNSYLGNTNSAQRNHLSVVMDSNLPREDKLRKRSSDTDPEKSRLMKLQMSSTVPHSHDQHPCFDESGSDEKNPLSGDLEQQKYKGDQNSVLSARNLQKDKSVRPQVSLKEQRPVETQENEKLQKNVAVMPRVIAHNISPLGTRNKDHDEGDSTNCERIVLENHHRNDSMIIEEYSTDSSGTEHKQYSASTSNSICDSEAVPKARHEIDLYRKHVPDTQDAIVAVMAVRRMDKDHGELPGRKQRTECEDPEHHDVVVVSEESESENEGCTSALASKKETFTQGKKAFQTSLRLTLNKQRRNHELKSYHTKLQEKCSSVLPKKMTQKDSTHPSHLKVQETFVTVRRGRTVINREDLKDSTSRKKLKPSYSVKSQDERKERKRVDNLSGPGKEISERLGISNSSSGEAVCGVPGSRKRKTDTDSLDTEVGNFTSNRDLKSKDGSKGTSIEISDRPRRPEKSKCRSDIEGMLEEIRKKHKIGRYSDEKEKVKTRQACSSRRECEVANREKLVDRQSHSKMQVDAGSPNTSNLPCKFYSSVKRSCLSSSFMKEEMDSSIEEPSVQSLLDFLDIGPDADKTRQDYSLSLNMRDKVYKIFQKPIDFRE